MHRYGNKEERIYATEKKWKEWEAINRAANIPELCIDRDYYVDLYTNHYKRDSRQTFRMLEYLGTYALTPHEVDIISMKRFLNYHFNDGEPENMRFYYTIHPHPHRP